MTTESRFPRMKAADLRPAQRAALRVVLREAVRMHSTPRFPSRVHDLQIHDMESRLGASVSGWVEKRGPGDLLRAISRSRFHFYVGPRGGVRIYVGDGSKPVAMSARRAAIVAAHNER